MAITDNITAYWDFNGFVRGEDIEDLAGSNDLTSSSSANTFPFDVPGLSGMGREFDSSGGHYLKCDDSAGVSIQSGTSFTILSWMMFHDSPPYDSSLSNSSDSRPLKAMIRKGGATQFDDEWKLELRLAARGKWTGIFQVNEAGTAFADRATSVIRPYGYKNQPYNLFTNTWHMVVGRYDHSKLKTNLRIYQGISGKTGTPIETWSKGSIFNADNQRIMAKLGQPFIDTDEPLAGAGVYRRSITGSGFTSARDDTNELRIGAPVFTHQTQRDKSDFTIDGTGTWSRYLTNAECDILFNGGYGLEYPFYPPWTACYGPKPTPLFLPRPATLYEGYSCRIGASPEVVPAPNGWHHTQPTLPAWRIPPRIAGWSYGNNFPRPAPEPLVSQWWIQASEPVNTDPRIEHLAPGPLEVAPRAGGDDPVIPAPPPPPAPPADDSEAIISDAQYRPGRADIEQSRYGKS